MSQRYTEEEKASILAKLQANKGNIALTHLQTGVPERTLFAWRREAWLQQRQLRHPLPSQQETGEGSPDAQAHSVALDIPTFNDDLEAVRFVRSQIMKELVNLGASLTGDFDVTTPYQRVQVLSQLLNRLMKLDAHLQPYMPVEQTIRIEYADPSMMEDTNTGPSDQVSLYDQILAENPHYAPLPSLTSESPAAHNTDRPESLP